MLEDACWLQPEAYTQHINLAKLDTLLKGINLAFQWQGKVLHVKTDSVCVYHWISDSLAGKACVCTKVSSEMLIRRRMSTLKVLMKEYALTVDVMLVPSIQNIAEWLKQVPQWWFEMMKKETGPEPLISAAHIDELDASQIMAVHRGSGQLGVRHTTFLSGEIAQQ